MSPLNLDMRRTALVLVDPMPRIIALPTVPHTGEQVHERCLRLFSRLGVVVAEEELLAQLSTLE